MSVIGISMIFLIVFVLMMMMKSGKIIASGKPDDVLTGENLEAVYRIKANVKLAENTPFVIPLTRIPKKEE